MKTALEIILFVIITLGPIAALWFRIEREKRRRAKSGENPNDYLDRNSGGPGLSG